MSILKTFRNFKLSIFIVFILLSIITLSIFNIGFDFEKMKITHTIEGKMSKSLNYKNNQGETGIQLLKEHQLSLLNDFDAITALHEQDYFQHFFIDDKKTKAALKSFQNTLFDLNSIVLEYYSTKEPIFLENFKELMIKLTVERRAYNQSLIQDINEKNKIALYIALVSFINILLIFIWYARKLSIIYKDIKIILSIEEDDRSKNYATAEFTAIKRRLERRPLASGGKNLLDPLTGLLNEKGLITEYVQRGTSTAREYICVTVFDIDNYKELAQNYGKTFTEGVIKKFAFILNLEKKPSDIVGRMGEDQFIMITARTNQAEAFTTVDTVRVAMEKTKFKAADGKITITVSGGFTPKEKHEKIESAISTANSLVKKAKVQGKNVIMKQQGFSRNLNDRM
jgi:diguanylate cyclase (GGDEF)-like protein